MGRGLWALVSFPYFAFGFGSLCALVFLGWLVRLTFEDLVEDIVQRLMKKGN